MSQFRLPPPQQIKQSPDYKYIHRPNQTQQYQSQETETTQQQYPVRDKDQLLDRGLTADADMNELEIPSIYNQKLKHVKVINTKTPKDLLDPSKSDIFRSSSPTWDGFNINDNNKKQFDILFDNDDKKDQGSPRYNFSENKNDKLVNL